jgi:hypothetical protein
MTMKRRSVLTWMGLAKTAADEPDSQLLTASGVDCTTSDFADCRVEGRNRANLTRHTKSVSFGKVQNEETATSCQSHFGLSVGPDPVVDYRSPSLWIAPKRSLVACQVATPKSETSETVVPIAKSRGLAMDFEKPGSTLDMAHFLKTTTPPRPVDVKAQRRKQRIPSPISFLRPRRGQDQNASDSNPRFSYPPESVVQKISKAGTKYLHIVTENPDDDGHDS